MNASGFQRRRMSVHDYSQCLTAGKRLCSMLPLAVAYHSSLNGCGPRPCSFADSCPFSELSSDIEQGSSGHVLLDIVSTERCYPSECGLINRREQTADSRRRSKSGAFSSLASIRAMSKLIRRVL